jgi:hypothetical protein
MERHVARLGPPPVGISAQPGQCVYTCGRDATTDDHVPPSGLLGGLPDGGPRLKVPSCKRCNGGSSKDDAYFRRTVAPNLHAGRHPAARAAWEKELRALQYPEAAAFKRAFYESMSLASRSVHAC